MGDAGVGVPPGQGVGTFAVDVLDIVVFTVVIIGDVVTTVVSVASASSVAYTSVRAPAVTEIRSDQSW